MAVVDITRGVNRSKHIFNQLISGYFTILFVTAALFFFCLILFFALINKSHDNHILLKWFEANAIQRIPIIQDKTVEYKHPNGDFYTVDVSAFLMNHNIRNSLKRSKQHVLISLAISTILSMVIFVFLNQLFVKYGKQISKGKHIRGGMFSSNIELVSILKREKKLGKFHVGGVHLPKGFETNHVFISGATDTGKSNAIKEILDTVRDSNQKFICYDKSGEYISIYYRRNYDILLNPFDQRMVSGYGIWNECHHDYDYESLASSFLPSVSSPLAGSSSEHFIYSGRTLLCDTMRRLKDLGIDTTENLMKYINQVPLKELHDFLVGTDAQGTVNPGDERHASGVRSTVTPKIKSLRYLQGNNGNRSRNGFSLKEWVKSDYDKRCVFITCNGSQKQVLSPLISAWFDIFSKQVLSLEESRERRIWMVVDEVASLPKIDSLIDFSNEARKFGGCGIFSVTSVEELYRIYGTNRAKTLVGMCGTKLTYRCDEPDTAQWISKLYLEEEFKEFSEGVHMSNDSRGDSINMNDRRSNQPLFTPSEIMQLDKFDCLLKIPGAYPVTKLKIEPKERKQIAEGFIEKEIKLKPIVADGKASQGSPPIKSEKLNNKPENKPSKRPLL